MSEFPLLKRALRDVGQICHALSPAVQFIALSTCESSSEYALPRIIIRLPQTPDAAGANNLVWSEMSQNEKLSRQDRLPTPNVEFHFEIKVNGKQNDNVLLQSDPSWSNPKMLGSVLCGR